MIKLTRRSFIKGSAALTGITLATGKGFFHQTSPAYAEDNSRETFAYTYCDMCNQTPKCGINAVIRNGKIVRVESRENYPNAPLCAKGIASLQELYDPERLLYPVKRTRPKGDPDPGWQRISWDEAYDTIVKKLNEIKEREGPEKVLFYVGDPKEPRSAVQRLAYTFGSPNYGNESSTCFRAAALASLLVFGLVTLGSDPTPKTRTCLIWSKNPAWSGPYGHWKLHEAKERGTKFIVVDPRVTPTVSGLADIHLQLRPGTDGALALGLINVIIREGMYDREFVDRWVLGFPELKAYVQEFTPERVEKITWVPKEKIETAAKLFATEKPATWIGSASPTVHSSNAIQNHRAILALVALTGNFDVEGGVTIPTEPLPFDLFAGNPAFNRETDIFPQIRDKRVDKEYFPVWAHYINEIQMNMLPEYVEKGLLKAMVMFGGNAMMWPQTTQYQQAIARMEFSVAADYYLRPWTHNFMDMVLPAAMTYERMAPLAIFGRKIYLREPVIKPLGEARSDWRIAFELGTRLGYPEEFWHGDEEAALNELLKPLNLTVDDLRKHPEGLEIPPKGPNKFRKYELGLLRQDGEPGFPTPSGKVEIASQILAQYKFNPLPVYREPLESPLSTPELAKKFPLILNTGSRVPMYTHSKLRELPWLNQFMPEPVVRINPKDAAARGIKDGDDVILASPHGEIKLKASVTNIVLPGVIDVFHGWPQANVNMLVPRNFDPISGYPPYKEGLCEVKKT
ncbi:molybdopterin-containing oxidoreductase family protein [Neomoorella humiferrea]|uniref:Acetylene hydratase n=1 Tax=Neomoorella humiferrea TaxID=676965 RepID=A0A2T0AWF6_9FIRM|nr:molybdopterin-dependent oxidoreductase [Moorella humiferrea]PRR75042.1 Acetylene hydratase [Moorella humiferrea]